MAPIRPENRDRYPHNWNEIRHRILSRAKHACERCGVKNGLTGYRDENGEFVRLETEREQAAARESGQRVFRIVLTIMHLDHQPENCADANLQAGCQRCHLVYDRDHHAQSRRQNADRSSGQSGFPWNDVVGVGVAVEEIQEGKLAEFDVRTGELRKVRKKIGNCAEQTEGEVHG